MNESTNGILNTVLVSKYVCEKCGGALVEKFADGQFAVRCAKGCEAGFITRRKHEKRASKKLEDYMEAAANYPQLLPQEQDPEKRKVDLASMF